MRLTTTPSNGVLFPLVDVLRTSHRRENYDDCRTFVSGTEGTPPKKKLLAKEFSDCALRSGGMIGVVASSAESLENTDMSQKIEQWSIFIDVQLKFEVAIDIWSQLSRKNIEY